MRLNDKYKLGTDEFNVILYEKKIMEKGKAKKKEDENIEIEKVEIWKPIAFYATVEQALNGVIRREINGTGLESLQLVVDKINELKEFIQEVTNK
ncbi:MAG: hypothetical protein MR639_15355 [Clostridium sp.]|uniref:hypothetical protein n=1 Tax=Clostridium sp. TaxID=1506 RepID=UPI002A8DDE7B|nr:hypothetical protein [Clostridium sp.]MDY5098532.1 hypothetical protein [Clostridium sp.]